MRFSIITLLLFLFAGPLEARPLVGSGNSDCASAQVVTSGTYVGQLTDQWYYEMFTHQVLWYTDQDWYRITVPPNHQLAVQFQLSVMSGSMGLYATNVRSACTGTPLASSSPAVVVNTSPVAKDYLIEMWAWSALSQTDLYVNYTLNVQVTPIPVGNTYCPGSPNSSGSPANLAGQGSPSVAANALSFVASNLPFNSPALLFDGTAQAQVPFGDGSLCLSGSLNRLTLQFANAGGNWSAPLDFTTLMPSAVITAGSTWNFQLFYRDVGGPLGTGFNLTNGVQITFLP